MLPVRTYQRCVRGLELDHFGTRGPRRTENREL
jgi:hypothetical protein